MNNKLNAIATFLRVAEAGSFSAAARQSGMKQSAVSQQIAALEESLGVVLLHRTTRVMALTGQGKSTGVICSFCSRPCGKRKGG
jgi:DNA-binding transcriptional LysR family regulator